MEALFEASPSSPDAAGGGNQDQHADKIGVAEDEKHHAVSPFGKDI